MDKGEIAKLNFISGLNCAQSVVLAFKDELNENEDFLSRLSIGFGGGIARQRLVCGAVSGMVAVLGALLSDGKDKASIYQTIQSACAEFKREVGSLICEELLSGKVNVDCNPVPEARSPEYYKKRPCAELCALAAEITQKYLLGEGN